jgi:hypothetical protein
VFVPTRTPFVVRGVIVCKGVCMYIQCKCVCVCNVSVGVNTHAAGAVLQIECVCVAKVLLKCC